MVAPRASGGGRAGRSTAGGRALRRGSLVAALAALMEEGGTTNVMAAAMLTISAPTMAGVFVHQVSTMRSAQLEREAIDRVQFAARMHGEGRLQTDRLAEEAPAVSAPGSQDLAGRLDTMLASRAVLADTFGDEPTTVAPIYAKVIRQMLRDDDATFITLTSSRDGDSGAYNDAVAEREQRLRVVHAKLTRLVGG